jgi:hypothetical protein
MSAVFWVVAPCSLVEINQRFRGPCCLVRPDDGDSKDLWNVGKFLPDYTVLQPRRQPSSYSPPWEPQILVCKENAAINCITVQHKKFIPVNFDGTYYASTVIIMKSEV